MMLTLSAYGRHSRSEKLVLAPLKLENSVAPTSIGRACSNSTLGNPINRSRTQVRLWRRNLRLLLLEAWLEVLARLNPKRNSFTTAGLNTCVSLRTALSVLNSGTEWG